ncbi:MAG: nuclear transport factor 2 family protein [Steroidobacteraceae bacterium]
MNIKLVALAAIALCASANAARVGPAEDSPRTVVERRFAAVTRYDVKAIMALYAPDAVETSPAFCSQRFGPDGARRTYSELFKAYPTISAHITSMVVEGNHVAVEFLARTRKADGSMASETRLANFLTVEQGKITRDDTYFDTKGSPCS